MNGRNDDRGEALPPELIEALLEAIAPGEAVPSDGVRSTLMRRIAQTPPITTVRADESGWFGFSPGVEARVLRDDGVTRTWLARMAPGSTLPAHDHPGDEEFYILEGCVEIGGLTMRAGDFQIAGAGTRHETHFSPQGCIALVRSPSPAARCAS